jgi:DNA replication ATP-dependent helicase Dna2
MTGDCKCRGKSRHGDTEKWGNRRRYPRGDDKYWHKWLRKTIVATYRESTYDIPVTPQQEEIVTAIEAEIEKSSKKRRFRVVSASMQPKTIKIVVHSQPDGGTLDHSLEGGVAAWGKSVSPVVAVSIDESALYLHRFDQLAPLIGEEIAVQPPRFLESLLRCWRDDELGSECFAWAAHALVGRSQCPLILSPSFPELRARQKSAYSLLSYQAGFLWGPPGTGKTRTAASIVADSIVSNADLRILLLAPINSAVDQLLINVDDRLAASIAGQQLRSQCARIGNNFIAGHYKNRHHLLPQGKDELILEKARLEFNRPMGDDIDARAQWQREMDRVTTALRSEVELVLREKRVVAMTTVLATMHYKVLREQGPFDLVVFDEASQTGRAICLMLALLGRRALVAGDPRQLAPIFSSTHLLARKWFGRTLFDEYMHPNHPSTCFLNEQSRMALPICDLVSKVFYDGELHVSDDCLRDKEWQAARAPLSVCSGPLRHIHLVEVDAESAAHGGSHHRLESGQVIAMIAQQLIAHVNPAQILVLTPFVGQRKLIRKTLDARGLNKVRVSTVHAAQGAERLVVIFDPVKGNSSFLNKPENRARLLNVAISRAQACFVLIASVSDLQHPLLSQIAKHIGLTEHYGVASSGL